MHGLCLAKFVVSEKKHFVHILIGTYVKQCPLVVA